ncbi:efflux RND transporter periplasmic adaptor subunit [Leptodesmis sp.]|uniref:efflux RND transporter periplasmic adaptor subunit n=1 Tax=Leptodesmis sp. TaxID=3100501 RepID=UPI00405357B8
MKDLIKLRPPKWLLALLVLGLVAGGGYVAYSQITTAQRQEARRRIQTATVEQVNLPVTISANGTVQPERSVNVSPKTSGKLKQLLVKEGDRVQEGQVLAYMDDSNLQGQYTQAQGQLAQARANLQRTLAGNRAQDIAQAQAQVESDRAALWQADQTFQQNKQLYESGAITQRDFNTSLATRDQAAAQLTRSQQALALQRAGSRPEDVAQARAQVKTAEGQLQTIRAQLEDTIIRAPFSGIITKKFADPGAFVTPTTSGSSVTSATSSSILALASNNQVVANVAESNIAQIKLGVPATIKADAYPGQSFNGQVIQIAAQSTTVQNVTSFEVKSSVTDPKNLLKAGMSVNVDFNVGTLKNVLVIPTVAITRQEGASGVLVMTGEQESRRPEFRPITTGATVNDKTVVLSGLKAGERVLISFPQGERPQSRTPSVFPGMGPGGGGGRRR